MTGPFFEGLGGFGAHLLDQAELRRRVAAFCRQHEGLRSSGLTEAQYEALIFPNDRPEWRKRAADDMFSCALRFLAVCRGLGVPHPLLAEPYQRRVGKAMSDVEAVAKAYGALVIGKAVGTYEPQAGDAMLTGHGNDLHCSCIVEVVDGYELHCVDGGQGGRGDMQIQANLYELDWGADAAIVRSIEPPRWSTSRPGPPKPVRSYVDLWQLCLGAGLLT